MDASYPFYVIKRKSKWSVVASPLNRDITHPCLWKILVARMVAVENGVGYREIIELPYCQHRGRIVGNRIYIGTVPEEITALLCRKFIGFAVIYDEHENITEYDLTSFNCLKSG